MDDRTAHMIFEFLDPKQVRMFRGPSGMARLMVDGADRSYLKVAVARAFPVTEPNRYIGLLDGDGKDIGTVEDLRLLDPESRRVAEEELERRYFMPRITCIHKLSHEFDMTYFEVETDRGRRDFSLRGHSENCVEVSPNRYIIEDVDGCRFEIPNLKALDTRSQTFMECIL